MERKLALVTGGNRGIGFEIVRQLAQQRVEVILAARRLADAEFAAKKIATSEMPVYPLQLDVTHDGDVQNAAAFIDKTFGRLDILINNAGVALEGKKLTTKDLLRQTFEINTIGTYVLTETLLPLLKKSSAGRIVNHSSRMGSMTVVGNPEFDEDVLPAYCASKAALNMLTVIMARQLEQTNIKVNAAHPGWVKTRMGGEDAPLSPQEGAKTAIRLALLPDNGPTGKFFHGNEELPW